LTGAQRAKARKRWVLMLEFVINGGGFFVVAHDY